MLIHVPFTFIVSLGGNKNNKTQSILAISPLSFLCDPLPSYTVLYSSSSFSYPHLSFIIVYIHFACPSILFLFTTTPFLTLPLPPLFLTFTTAPFFCFL